MDKKRSVPGLCAGPYWNYSLRSVCSSVRLSVRVMLGGGRPASFIYCALLINFDHLHPVWLTGAWSFVWLDSWASCERLKLSPSFIWLYCSIVDYVKVGSVVIPQDPTWILLSVWPTPSTKTVARSCRCKLCWQLTSTFLVLREQWILLTRMQIYSFLQISRIGSLGSGKLFSNGRLTRRLFDGPTTSAWVS